MSGDGVDADAVHGPPVDRDVAVSEEPVLRPDVIGVGGGPAGEEGDEVGVQGMKRSLRSFPTGVAPFLWTRGFGGSGCAGAPVPC